jgi:serine/threonine protein kinase
VHQLQEGEMAGSVCYMAPEVLLETGTCLRSDVYSLAMMTWELVTLELPMVQFQTMEQVQNRVARGHWRPSLSNIPIRSLRNIIKKGWTHKVSDRLSAKEMQVQLRQVCGRGNGDEISDSASETTVIRSLLSVIETHEKPSVGGGSSSFSSIFRKKKG